MLFELWKKKSEIFSVCAITFEGVCIYKVKIAYTDILPENTGQVIKLGPG